MPDYKRSEIKLSLCVYSEVSFILFNSLFRLSDCEITEAGCSTLAAVLSSELLCLKLLDLSSNALHDSGIKLISDGLRSFSCTLQTLR